MGDRGGITVTYTKSDSIASVIQVMTWRAMRAPELVAWAIARYGSARANCTLDSTGVKTHVQRWQTPEGLLVEIATTPELPNLSSVTISRDQTGAFPCPGS